MPTAVAGGRSLPVFRVAWSTVSTNAKDDSRGSLEEFHHHCFTLHLAVSGMAEPPW